MNLGGLEGGSVVAMAGGAGSATLVSLGPGKDDVLPRLHDLEDRLRASRQIASERKAQAEETSMQIANARRNIELQLTQAEFAAKESVLLEQEGNRTARKIRDLISEKEVLANQLATVGGELEMSIIRLNDLEALANTITTGAEGGGFVQGFQQGFSGGPGNISGNRCTSQQFSKLIENQDYDAAWRVINRSLDDVKKMDAEFYNQLEDIRKQKDSLRNRNKNIQEQIDSLTSKVQEAKRKINIPTGRNDNSSKNCESGEIYSNNSLYSGTNCTRSPEIGPDFHANQNINRNQGSSFQGSSGDAVVPLRMENYYDNQPLLSHSSEIYGNDDGIGCRYSYCPGESTEVDLEEAATSESHPTSRMPHIKSIEELLATVRSNRDSFSMSPDNSQNASPLSHRRHPSLEDEGVSLNDWQRSTRSPTSICQENYGQDDGDMELDSVRRYAGNDHSCVVEMRLESVSHNAGKVGKAKVVERFIRLTQLFKGKKKM